MMILRKTAMAFLVALILMPSLAHPQTDQESMLEKGKTFFSQGKYFYATTWLERVLKARPATSHRREVLIIIIKSYALSGHDDKAESYRQVLLKEFPDAAGALGPESLGPAGSLLPPTAKESTAVPPRASGEPLARPVATGTTEAAVTAIPAQKAVKAAPAWSAPRPEVPPAAVTASVKNVPAPLPASTPPVEPRHLEPVQKSVTAPAAVKPEAPPATVAPSAKAATVTASAKTASTAPSLPAPLPVSMTPVEPRHLEPVQMSVTAPAAAKTEAPPATVAPSAKTAAPAPATSVARAEIQLAAPPHLLQSELPQQIIPQPLEVVAPLLPAPQGTPEPVPAPVPPPSLGAAPAKTPPAVKVPASYTLTTAVMTNNKKFTSLLNKLWSAGLDPTIREEKKDVTAFRLIEACFSDRAPAAKRLAQVAVGNKQTFLAHDSGEYCVVVGSLFSEKDAEKEKTRLASKGVTVKIRKSQVGQPAWRASFGRYPDLQKAEKAAKTLASRGIEVTVRKIGE